MTDRASQAGGNKRHILVVRARALCPLSYQIPAVHSHHHPRYDDKKTENRDDGAGGIVEVERTVARRRRVATIGHAKLCARYYALLGVRVRRVVVIIGNGKTTDGAEVVVEPVDRAAHADTNW